ncbi:RraA family protein [Pseudonocardiaceae bacterium YIM PH 21723]|nr:RraA family protein [Pseudonocardiaceae bacterium YIM PH 21723]
MDHQELQDRFASLTTAHLADACVRAGVDVRTSSIGPVAAGMRLAGRVLPARHAGSVDVFLEAFQGAQPGDVLVVDDRDRVDESCVGDLVVLEAQAAGLAGVVIWGRHRDTAEIESIGLPVFSRGAVPTGPLKVRPRAANALDSAQIDYWTVGPESVVCADADGVVFLPADRLAELFDVAEAIRDTERAQADRIRQGESLRAQLRFAEYLTARAQNPELTFREHLRAIGGAVEE